MKIFTKVGGGENTVYLENQNSKFSKENIKLLLEKILKKTIIDIQIQGIEFFENITEYNFSLIKLKIIYEKYEEEIFFRVIKGGKIKESIFCFWSLLYEEYLKNSNSNDNSAVQKAIITQIMSKENTSSVVLTIDSKLNYCAEIYLVELRKFFEKNKKEERWLESLEIKDNDILFIGKKMY